MTVRITSPREGETITGTTAVTGTADSGGHEFDGYEVWLLSRQGSGGAYRPENPCPGGRTFRCEVTRPDTAGEDKFRLAVIVVDPATAATIDPGAVLATLPRHAARHEITVRRGKNPQKIRG